MYLIDKIREFEKNSIFRAIIYPICFISVGFAVGEYFGFLNGFKDGFNDNEKKMFENYEIRIKLEDRPTLEKVDKNYKKERNHKNLDDFIQFC